MKILYCGDVVGRTGRDVIAKYIPHLRKELALDFVIINGENAAHGFGITTKQCQDFFDLGIDCITLGNHAWDQKEIFGYIDQEPRLIRPRNYPTGTPGRGIGLYSLPKGQKILIIQVMGRLFMDPLDDPFASLETELSRYRLGQSVQAIIIDIHGEASSEKMSLAHFADGRASLVIGSHTHIPTADTQILPGGTAYQTDAGMCGDYDSVIGMKKEAAVKRFTRKIATEKLSPAEGEATLCGVLVTTDDQTGFALSIEPIRLGGRIKNTTIPI
jgi:metallophosphoesterase (TIGR00282 family)